MGAVRLFLALAVALTHRPVAGFYGLTPLYGDSAVEGFFTISGFFIAMVICEKASYASPFVFYTSRYLRLWPAYIVCVILTLIAVPQSRFVFASGPLEIFAALGIFLQDLQSFLYPKFVASIIPQAWSLGVELWFYLFAPFMLHRLSTSALYVAVGLGARILLWAYGLTDDPWSHRFAPAEALYFGLGACAYHVSKLAMRPLPKGFGAAVGVIACLVILYCVADRGRAAAHGFAIVDWKPLLLHDVWFHAVLLLAIPFMSAATGSSRIDKFLGDLSYPIYLLVYAIGHLVEGVAWPHLNAIFLVLLLIAGTGVLIIIEWPVETFRRRFIASGGVVKKMETSPT